MKVLCVSPKPLKPEGQRGIPPFYYYLLKELPRRGHEVHYLVPTVGYPEREFSHHGIRVHSLGIPFGLIMDRFSFMDVGEGIAARWWNRILIYISWAIFMVWGIIAGMRLAVKLRPDIIYGQTENSAVVCAVLKKLFNVPYVLRIFGIRELLNYYNRGGIKRLLIAPYLLSIKLPANAYVITNDGTGGDVLMRKLKIPRRKFHFLINGIPRPHEDVTLTPRHPDREIILSTTRLDKRKGLDLFIKAVHLVSKQRPRILGVLAGEGGERASLENLAASIGISDHILFAGRLDWEGVLGYLRECRVYCALGTTTNHTNALHEAMDAGCCSVVLNRGNLNNILVDSETGILVEHEDPVEIGDAVLRLLKDESAIRRIGNAARTKNRSLIWSWEDRIDYEVSVLEQCAEKIKPPVNCIPGE